MVGNITVGGTGKTPLVAWLVEWLRARGFKPGIVSRGYGGTATVWPQNVTASSDPHVVGDEAVLLAQHTHCPMVVAPQRVAAVTKLLNDHDCDVVISDDGLQHYALGRTVEIAVVDGVRRFGNGFCLPAGPLREPMKRLKSVDFVVANGKAHNNEYAMCLYSGDIYNIKDPEKVTQMLQLIKMESFRKRYPSELSGGQQQRVAIARTLALSPQLLLLDEPFSSLDSHLKADLRNEIKNIVNEIGVSMVFITHDILDALDIADEIIFLKDGEILQHTSTKNIFKDLKNKDIQNTLNGLKSNAEKILQMMPVK